MIRESRGDRIFTIINTFFLAVLLFTVAYPLYFVVIAAISSPAAVNSGGVWLWPQGITFEGFRYVLSDDKIWVGYKNTVVLTIVGTIINLIVTFTGAYALSKSKLPGMKVIMVLLTFTMFFGGGLIPSYILVSQILHMRNTLWALILPSAASMYNIILTRTYFLKSIPDELVQASKIDGCSDIRAFGSIILPLSKPIIATMALFYGVGHWNQFFQALIYISKKEMYPLQLILRELLLISNNSVTDMLSGGMQSGGNMEYIAEMMQRAELLKYSIIIVATLPVLAIYPFLQKYFMKGILAGSLKG